jgi:hypothetical protein
VEHLWKHAAIHRDGLFHDPLITTLAGLIGWRVNISDGSGYTCPLFGCACNHRTDSIYDLVLHMKRHPKEIKVFHKCLGIF